MNIFAFGDYKEALRAIVKERKQFERGFGFHMLADAARIQRPYLSKVMKGAAQLSNDQMFLIARFLKLDADECEFLQLLVDHERTAIAERKTQLAAQLKQIADRHRDSGAHLQAKAVAPAAISGLADYYLDPLCQVVHMAIAIERYAKNPSTLAAELHMPGAQLRAILDMLERMGLTYRDDGKLKVRESSLHLPKASPLYRAWRNQTKLLSAQRLNQLDDREAYSFSVVFAVDQKTRTALHHRFLDYLKDCEQAVAAAPAEQVCQLSFDLFPWTPGR